MSNPASTPIRGSFQNRINRGQVVVGLPRSHTRKPPLDTFNPDPWLRASRTTPGMTNRTNEERVPANPGPGQYKSYKHEMADTFRVNNEPGVFRRREYIGAALLIGAFLILAFFSE